MIVSVHVPMCMSDKMVEYSVEVTVPVTLKGIKEAAGKKFKDFKVKKGHAYHNVTGEELTDDIIASMFSGVGGAGVVLSNKEWNGALRLRERFGASYGTDRANIDSVFCERATEFLTRAEAVLVLAGAGMGVDSGFDTFRSKDGSYTKEEYVNQARHAIFEEDPDKAWRWHGPMLEKFRTVPPHQGYGKLLDICNVVGNYFVCTSNIDGAFLKSGFPCARVFEAHGSVHVWQCVDSKCNRSHEPWPAGTIDLDRGLPQCKNCGGLARPNVAFFDDGLGRNARTFNTRYIEPQKAWFANWLKHLIARRIVIVELGCGVSEHSLRMIRKADGTWACMSGEWKIPPLACPLIRIDPDEQDHDAGENFVHIARGAEAACMVLADQVCS